MKKKKSVTIVADGHEIAIRSGVNSDYIRLSDIAKYDEDDPARTVEDPNAVIANWMRSRSTISYLSIWESLHNPSFNFENAEKLKYLAGRPSFTLSPKKWIKDTGAIGIQSEAGRYGGTFAHRDIAFEFASWVSPKFKLLLIVDYQHLKGAADAYRQLDWGERDGISLMATPSVPKMLSAQPAISYSEDDIVNLALFGRTEAQWQKDNPDAEGSLLRNATFSQALVRSSLVSTNNELIKKGVPQTERLVLLNKAAIEHMELLRIHGENIKRMDHGVLPTPPNVVPVPAMMDTGNKGNTSNKSS